MTGKTYLTPFRRRREEKTNFKKRLASLKSGKERFVVRRKSNTIIAEVVKYNKEGDVTVASATSKQLGGFGWSLHGGSLPAAYLTGLLCGLKAAEAGTKRAIADIGLHTPVAKSAVFAAIKGGLDAGLDIPSDAEVFPSEERISGKHISDYAGNLNGDELKTRFGKAIENGADPKKADEIFAKCKGAIMNKFGAKKESKEE